MTGKLFESYVLTGINVTKYGHIKTCRELAEGGATAIGIDTDRARGSVSLLDEALIRKINKPVAQAREYMKKVTVPWSSSRNNDNGGRISGNEYLLSPDKLVEYEQRMSEYRMQWEDILQKELFSKWDKFRAQALTDLNGMFQEHFIPLDELRKRYKWEVWIKPLIDVANISDDVRLKAPQKVIDRALDDMTREQAQKISNAVGSIADSVMREASEIVEGIESYVYTEGDNRKGNHLPKEKGWKTLENLADRIDDWCDALSDSDLEDAASQIRDLVGDIRSLGNGSLKDARSALSGEDGTQRMNVKKKLEDIQQTARPATNRLEDFLG